MTTLISPNALAYVNFGRWIADCPLGCGGAQALEARQTNFFCNPPSGCGHIATIEWPSDPDGIWEALEVRRMPKTRNWFPKNHELALRANAPHGQSVEDLIAETAENGE